MVMETMAFPRHGTNPGDQGTGHQLGGSNGSNDRSAYPKQLFIAGGSMGIPQARWMVVFMENPKLKWMI